MLIPEVGHNGFLLTVAGLAVAGTILICAAIKARFDRSYAQRTLLNQSERKLFSIIERSIRPLPARPRLLCQVSYGEFLSTRSRRAFWRINYKRADFVIVDRQFNPLIVIEYQGLGHYGGSMKSGQRAYQSDKIKRQACLSAGLPWLAVPARYDPDLLRVELLAALDTFPTPIKKETADVRRAFNHHDRRDEERQDPVPADR